MNTSAEYVRIYLKKACELETSCYEQRTAINRLRRAIESAKNPGYFSMEKCERPPSTTTAEYLFAALIGGVLAILPGLIAGLITAIMSDSWGGFPIGFIIAILCGMAIVIKIEANAEDERMKEYHEALEENRKRKETNDRIKKESQQKLNKLTYHLEMQQKLYNRTHSILQELYSLNIIYPKYRNLIAVCSLYEYFDSGRCSQLEGHEGGYNIYETELRLNRISDQLNVIIQNLEEIRNNQYVLYTAISSCNSHLQSVNRSIDTMSSHVQKIEENTVFTEYNSRITAKNTEITKWLETIRYIERK